MSETASDRPTWEQTWGQIALTMSRRSKCDRYKIGAVIVSPQNKVVATGYNGPPAHWRGDVLHGPENVPGWYDHCRNWCDRSKGGLDPDALNPDYSNCPANHAEINALTTSDRSDRIDGTMFVTGSMCLACAKAVANSGIRRVVFVNPDDKADAHRNPGEVRAFLRTCQISVGRVDV